VTAEDCGSIKALHEAMGMTYKFPDLTTPLFPLNRCIENENSCIVGAAALKLTAESFIWIDPKLLDRKKIAVVALLDRTMEREASELGLEQVSAWIPPEVEQRFAKLLTRLGWIRSPWQSWTKNF